MSWVDHLKAQLVTKGVQHCALVGLDGSIWGEYSSGVWNVLQFFCWSLLQLTAPEAKTIASVVKKPDSAFSTGIVVGGAKYLATRASDDLIAARKGQYGLFLIKTNKAVVLAIHDQTQDAGTISALAGKAADYFKSINY
jgi:profilin